MYTYYWQGSQLAAMIIGNTSGTVSETLKFYYDSNGIPFILDYNGTIYFYITNLQGDVIGLATSEGMGGTGAVLALGVSCSSLNGGYFNEKNEGSFTSGAIGGAVSGLIQGFAGLRFNVPGIIFGGSIGSGTGTFVTEFLDKYYGMKNEKNISQILDDAGQSADISLFTSSLTALIGQGVKMQLNEGSNELMKNFTKTFGDLINSFFSAIDDAITYILP